MAKFTEIYKHMVAYIKGSAAMGFLASFNKKDKEADISKLASAAQQIKANASPIDLKNAAAAGTTAEQFKTENDTSYKSSHIKASGASPKKRKFFITANNRRSKKRSKDSN